MIALLVFNVLCNVLWNVNCWFNNDNNNVVVLPVKHKEHELAYFVCVREKNGGCKIPAGNTINEWIGRFFFLDIFHRTLVNEILVLLQLMKQYSYDRLIFVKHENRTRYRIGLYKIQPTYLFCLEHCCNTHLLWQVPYPSCLMKKN